MSKKKIKIRDSIFLLVIICALIFIGKITKLNDLRAEKSDMYYRSPIQMAGVKELLYHQYDIVFSGGNVTVNRQKYVMDESMDSVLDQFYRSLNETEGKYN